MCSVMSEESYPWRAHPTTRDTLEVTVDWRWTRFSFSELTHLSSKRDTVSEHVVRQVVLSFASDSMSDDGMPHYNYNYYYNS